MRADAVWQAAKRIGGDFRSAFGEPGPAIPVSPLRAGEAVPGTVAAKLLTSLASYSRARANWREARRQQGLKEQFLTAQTAQMNAKAAGEMSPYQRETLDLAGRRLALLEHPPERQPAPMTDYQRAMLALRRDQIAKSNSPEAKSRRLALTTGYRMTKGDMSRMELEHSTIANKRARDYMALLLNGNENDPAYRKAQSMFGFKPGEVREMPLADRMAAVSALAARYMDDWRRNDPGYRTLSGRLSQYQAEVDAEGFNGATPWQDGSTEAEQSPDDWRKMVESLVPLPEDMEN